MNDMEHRNIVNDNNIPQKLLVLSSTPLVQMHVTSANKYINDIAKKLIDDLEAIPIN